MILWLLRKPQDSVNVLLPNNNNNTACKMSDAPEIYAFVSYLNDNEIVKSVREREEEKEEKINNTSSNASAAIFQSAIFQSPIITMNQLAKC